MTALEIMGKKRSGLTKNSNEARKRNFSTFLKGSKKVEEKNGETYRQ